jgi:hypothetical protein
MNDRKKVCMQKRQRKRKRTRRTFFFCLLSKCSIRLFFSPSASQKKSGKNRRVVFNSSNTILSLSVVCVCVFVFLTPSLFFLYIYAHLASANIHQCEKDRKEGKKNIYIGCRKRMENTRTRLCFLNIDSSEGKGREKEGEQPFIGKNILAERKEKQSRLEMCVDVEYVQKKCTHIHTHTAAIFIYSLFLNFRMHARSFTFIRSRYETLRIRKRTDAAQH